MTRSDKNAIKRGLPPLSSLALFSELVDNLVNRHKKLTKTDFNSILLILIYHYDLVRKIHVPMPFGTYFFYFYLLWIKSIIRAILD